MNNSGKSMGMVVVMASLLFSSTDVAFAEGVDIPLTESWKMTQGGKLYDNWAKVVYFDTKNLSTHPSYPKEGKKSGADTWRCKECHGWDYKGADGAYSKGSHYTGIKGVRDLVGKTPETIAKIVRNDLHGYSAAMIPDQALKELALFVARGQIDMDQYIDRATKKVHGNPQRGASFYQNICANCHGYDGRQINFKAAPKEDFIGTVASANPWETLHKIRNGQPGVPMISLAMLSIQDQLDILAYCQTLPEKSDSVKK
ncbi:MAG: c-type cytochrome [Motiliproteus sp.]